MENTQEQHLALISEMIQTARKEFNENGAIYLLWGWVILIASLYQFVMLRLHSEYNGLGWLILIPIAIIGQIVIFARQRKKERVKTAMDKVMGYVWTAVGVGIGTTILASNVLQTSTYPILMVVYAIGIYISGSIMQVTPMRWGAVCCWLLGISCFFVPFEYQLLFLAAAVLVAYIIPGYILKARYRKNV